MRWNLLDRLINFVGLIAWISFGVYALYMHNNLLPYIYVFFATGVMMAHTYLYCTRCKHFGENCYIFGGTISKNWFKGRSVGALDPDDSICASLWLLVALFPVPFLLYYMNWAFLGVQLVLVLGWFMIHSKTACAKCGNSWCRLNKKR